MKASFTVCILFATSHAHMAMVEPRWNFGTADTSMCDTDAKESAGNTTNYHGASFKSYQSFPDQAKEVYKCGWKEYRQSHWFNTGTQIGCPKVTGQVCGSVGSHSGPCCENPMKPTLTSANLLSFPGDVNATSNNTFNPWFAPGYAPVIDPCGIIGGYKWDIPDLYYGGPETYGSLEPCKEGSGCQINGVSAPEDMQFKAGTMGSELFHKALTNPSAAKANGEQQPVTKWTAGGVAEVATGALFANHGGGYQWRLCPAAEFTADGIKNEECFQRSPLEYATGKSAIQLGANHNHRHVGNNTRGSRVEFDAVRVTDANTDGVMPKGSTWTKYPVPNCVRDASPFDSCLTGDYQGTVPLAHPMTGKLYNEKKKLDLNFNEPAEGVRGFGAVDIWPTIFFSPDAAKMLKNVQEVKDDYDFTVSDTVKVPEKEGRYVLSWRWDSEQTPQVWSNCALVDIVQDRHTPRHSLRGAARS